MTKTASLVLVAWLASAASVLAQGLPAAPPQSQGLSAERLQQLAATMKGAADDGKVAGTVTLVARSGRTVHFDASGLHDVEECDAMGPDTILRIASMSKAVSSVAASAAQAGTQPPSGGGMQGLVDRVQSWVDPNRDGFFPWAGSVMPGGWAAVGAGYRHTVGREVRMDVVGGWSLRNYKLLDGGVGLPLTADRRLRLDVRGRLIDAPRVSFFGIGNDTSRAQETSFDFQPSAVGAQLRFRPVEGLQVGGGVGLLRIGSGPGSASPSIETVFTPQEVPALGQTSSFITMGAHAQADMRNAVDFTRDGGWYRVDWQNFRDRRNEGFGHQRIDVDLRQFLPVVNERHAVMVRGLVSATVAGDGTPPHYLLPTLGDGDNLRGFANQRFADRHRLLLQTEYRYRLTDRMYAAGFVDLGKVASRAGDMTVRGLHPGFGAGLRVTPSEAFGIRVDLARSSEQWAFIVSSAMF
jgi:hypothetical protein